MLLYLPANIVSAWAAISSISGTIAAKINGKMVKKNPSFIFLELGVPIFILM